MSQSFNLNYEDIRDESRTDQHHAERLGKAHNEFHSSDGHGRNICFVWLDGYRVFLNYAYLVAGEYSSEQNKITLSFTTHVITLIGVNLETLFYDIMNHSAKQIVCADQRYNVIGDGEEPIVNQITKENLGR